MELYPLNKQFVEFSWQDLATMHVSWRSWWAGVQTFFKPDPDRTFVNVGIFIRLNFASPKILKICWATKLETTWAMVSTLMGDHSSVEGDAVVKNTVKSQKRIMGRPLQYMLAPAWGKKRRRKQCWTFKSFNPGSGSGTGSFLCGSGTGSFLCGSGNNKVPGPQRWCWMNRWITDMMLFCCIVFRGCRWRTGGSED